MDFGLGGMFMDTVGTVANWMHQEEMQEDEQVFNASQAGLQREWAQNMSNTQYQRGVADMRAAGLNPALAYERGGAGVPSGASASSGSGPGGSAPRFTESMQAASAAAVNAALEDRTRAEAGKVRAEEKEILARTPTYGVQIDRLRQDIAESQEKIRLMVAQGEQTYASASVARQSVVNMQAELPRIRATVDQLRSMAALNDQQVQALAVQMGKSVAETKEIVQRVGANLPAVQGALVKAEEFLKRMQAPEAMNQAGLHSTVLGAFSTLLRAMNPLAGIIAVSR